MSGNRVAFTKAAASRIGDAVRWVEKFATDKTTMGRKLGTMMPQQLFAVRVDNDGGSAGDVSTNCSYTYTATLDSGFELGTGLSPQKCRLTHVPYNVGSGWGAGFYDKDGTFVLWDANECPQVEDPCE